MTIQLLLGLVAVIAILLTLIFRYLYKTDNSWIVSYLQNFSGVLFIISGFVKAADPLGLAYKMSDYFKEFDYHLEPTWFSFLGDICLWLNGFAVPFAVFMIVLELAIGVMLIIGYARKTTAILFAALVGFFTILTGFTYLTGYVPQEATFFNFGQWGAFAESNMRVTDCGCFGDFIKLKPFTSFLKDVMLIVPSVVFLIWWRQMHQLFNNGISFLLVAAACVISFVFCFSNYAWNLPGMDFRPFKVGTNIAEKKALEDAAADAVEILGFKLKNKASGQIVELGFDQYMSNYTSYPKEEWEVLEQLKSKPTLERSKVSEFHIYDREDYDIGEEILHSEKPLLLVISQEAEFDDISSEVKTFYDTIYRTDTLLTEGTPRFVRSVDTILSDDREVFTYAWKAEYEGQLETAHRIAHALTDTGLQTYLVVGKSSQSMLDALSAKLDNQIITTGADDLLLKTIIRSNLGYVLIQNGEILGKWHRKKVDVDKIRAKLNQ